MKRYRVLLAIILFFVLMYSFRGYVNPVKNNFLNESFGNTNADYDIATSTDKKAENPIDIESINTVKTATLNAVINHDKLLPVVGNVNSQIKEDLTPSGIFTYTNLERLNNGLHELYRSKELDDSAFVKLNDMFTKQYFEHVSPNGSSVSDVVRGVGYSFLIVGENLALGDFGGNSQVVNAWMESPGHRANMLDKRYTEIGIAVGYGMYNGKKQWIAVQHFGRPMSSCPLPSPKNKAIISSDEKILVGLESELVEMKKKLDSVTSSDSSFTTVVSSYNALVVDYNNRLKKLKTEISIYNEDVKNFNSCLDSVI